LDASQDTLVIDPVKLNIVNRVAAGSSVSGEQLHFKGGLLLQGSLSGRGEVAGRLVVWPTGQLIGKYKVFGDVYLLGHLGGVTDELDPHTTLECHGTVYVSSTGVSTGTIMAHRLRMYDGATLQGPFRTLRSNQSLPVLNRP